MSELFRIEDVIETHSYEGASRSSEVSDALKDGWYLMSAAHDPVWKSCVAAWASFVTIRPTKRHPMSCVAVLEINLAILSDEFGNSQLFDALFDAVKNSVGHEDFAMGITRAYMDEDGEWWSTKNGDTRFCPDPSEDDG